jgi:hypothetical protein
MNDMGLLSLIPLRTWLVGLGAAGAVACCAWVVLAIRSDAVDECNIEHQLVAAAQAEESHQFYLASVAEGERISKELLDTERKYADLKREYLTYANAITGNCSGAIGVLSNAAVAGAPVPAPTGKPDDATAPISAADLAENIVTNYAIANSNAAQLNGLQRWIEEVLK